MCVCVCVFEKYDGLIILYYYIILSICWLTTLLAVVIRHVGLAVQNYGGGGNINIWRLWGNSNKS